MTKQQNSLVSPHDADSVLAVIADVAAGKIPNAHFSHLPVVVVSADAYAAQQDKIDALTAELAHYKTLSGYVFCFPNK